MWRFLDGGDAGSGLQLNALLVLALLQQFQLAALQQDILLLTGQGLAQGGQGIVLKSQLTLHLGQLRLQIIRICHCTPPGPRPVSTHGTVIYCRPRQQDIVTT